MTDEYQLPPPATERRIDEIPKGNEVRSRIVATIVDYNSPYLTINDGSGQIECVLSSFSRIDYDRLKIGIIGRFVIENLVTEDTTDYRIIAFHVMDLELVNKYKQLIKIESSKSK